MGRALGTFPFLPCLFRHLLALLEPLHANSRDLLREEASQQFHSCLDRQCSIIYLWAKLKLPVWCSEGQVLKELLEVGRSQSPGTTG